MNKNLFEELKKQGKMCFLAPMDGYGDSAYRQTMKKIAPHILCVSEFYSADGLVHSKFLADSVLPHQKIEKPLIIQIFGKDPEMFGKAAKIIEQYDVAGIDVNMGCPAKKVVRSGHGSSLFINQDIAFKIVETLANSTHLPISVKTRLSFDGNQCLIDFAKGLENAGANLLTIHGRTAKQAYTGKADFTQIYELKKHLSIPIICNGDIEDYDDGINKLQNLDGFMIGRKSFGNPWCFLAGDYHPALAEILEIMEFHAQKLIETKGEKKGSLEIRKHLVQYLHNFPGVKLYRRKLVTVENMNDVLFILSEIKKDFHDYLDKKPSLGEIKEEI
ncbi:tRNA-dihydrouridine synthase family protein [Candidatus Gracilibacteria bacterium]|nr:tRNA-dihydrouridine synthase family protein [Candidatus Gracilibacteria bacterium]NUJ99433.1 tRNA-dihydrouridine synthase family protein [Candidatus Gracilibacteria bacterium]